MTQDDFANSRGLRGAEEAELRRLIAAEEEFQAIIKSTQRAQRTPARAFLAHFATRLGFCRYQSVVVKFNCCDFVWMVDCHAKSTTWKCGRGVAAGECRSCLTSACNVSSYHPITEFVSYGD